MPFGYGLWVWLKSNPAAQAALGIAAAILAFLTWLALHDRKVSNRALQKAEIKARKQSTKIINDMKETSNERIEDAETARNRVPAGVTSDGMRDDDAAFLFSDEPDGEPSG